MDPMGNERSGLIPPSLLKILITSLVRKAINQLVKSRLTSVDALLNVSVLSLSELVEGEAEAIDHTRLKQLESPFHNYNWLSTYNYG